MINWEEQWQLFAPGFREGFLPVSFGEKEVRLYPGPGFGDLSHETTQLMVEMLPKVMQETVIDIGCGSGILALGAKALGAKRVIGIDICQDALEHARKNALKNGLEVDFCLPKDFAGASEGTLLLNMIYSEQRVAWESLPSLHSFKGSILISGLLRSHLKEAQNFWKGWSLVEKRSKGQWYLLHLQKSG